ncbi:MAG: hypothetical protein ING66_03890 [Rhodocyclaceae bacterium]|jgi:hypothetical protein|nr:hypothetical protein [Rhodocyclaceae bacterium]MCA3044105.1 hypothetical protein [Rhodocyclaceae bacterium]MCA3061790.1 hypothetical protein [Rhodocyclaceae bacterium]
MSNREREKASDVFRNAELLFSKKGTFADAFPTIEDIKVIVKRGGHSGVNEWDKESHYGTNIGEYVDCSNPVCYNGGISVGDFVRSMVAANQVHFEKESIFCQGYEGSPKGKRRYRTCTNHFGIMIDIKYKPNAGVEEI